ncbi:MAG: hypothetical protein JNL43_00090 [Flavobacteriales bacterium]|nr:hypothetical protein [Flavobacteriales bacterium]
MREHGTSDGVLFYLSLLDNEIEERFLRFLSATGHGKAPSLAHLELTDAVIRTGPNGDLTVLRGGACTFPLYWSGRSKVRIATHLPITSGAFSRAGLAATLASVCLQSAYEPNAVTTTPIHGWRRIRRGATTRFNAGGLVTELPYLHHVEGEEDPERIAARIRTAFEAYAHAQRHVAASVVELSGGFDSTLAVAMIPAQRNSMLGASVEYPYYEFRFEAAVQQAVGSALNVARTVFDGTAEFPYTPPHTAPRFDEPKIFVTGMRHAERMARYAREHGAGRLYMGHGGDQLFCTDLLGTEAVSAMPERSPFAASAWRALRSAHRTIHASAWLQRSTACFVYDACQDVWAKETYGLDVRTPFTDLAVFRAALQWSHWCATRSAKPDKTILTAAMGDVLPQAVTERKGKVAYDGVWMRGYAHNAEHMASTIQGAAELLEHIGLSATWLVRRIRQLADRKAVSAREVMGAYALSTWLSSWGIQHPTDVEWVTEE